MQIHKKLKKLIYKKRDNFIQTKTLMHLGISLTAQKLTKFLVMIINELFMMKKVLLMKNSLLSKLVLLKLTCSLFSCNVSCIISFRLSCVSFFGYFAYYMLFIRPNLDKNICPIDHKEFKKL
jgi:hypothetical protein